MVTIALKKSPSFSLLSPPKSHPWRPLIVETWEYDCWLCRIHKDDDPQNHPCDSAFFFTPFSRLFLNRRLRILFLTLCSPVLLPLLCLSLPHLCLAHLCVCLCCRASSRDNYAAAGSFRRFEEGRKEEEEEEEEETEIGLLPRYLEDQLRLIGFVVAVYDCGGEKEVIIDDLTDLQEVSEIKRQLLIWICRIKPSWVWV